MKEIEGFVENEGNGRVGGKYYYMETESYLTDIEIDVKYNNDNYLVTCDMNFTCEEEQDKSVGYYHSGVTCNSIMVKKVEKYMESGTTEDRTYNTELVLKIAQLMNEENYLEEIADKYNDEAWNSIEG